MALPLSIQNEVQALASAVQAAVPFANASRVLLRSLQLQGAVVVNDIDTAFADTTPILDGPDPTGYLGDFAGDLINLGNAATEQLSLCDARGLVGRAVFNLDQVL